DGLVGGQVADLEAEGSSDREGGSAERLHFIHARKTGALFQASLRMGGALAGMDAVDLDRLEEFAKRFGLAFQIVDDLLDVVGDAGRLGKEVGKDEARRKLTFPALHGVSGARRLAKDEIDAAKASLLPFGERAAFLCDLADFVLDRQT